jgi:hypothetical protein
LLFKTWSSILCVEQLQRTGGPAVTGMTRQNVLFCMTGPFRILSPCPLKQGMYIRYCVVLREESLCHSSTLGLPESDIVVHLAVGGCLFLECAQTLFIYMMFRYAVCCCRWGKARHNNARFNFVYVE